MHPIKRRRAERRWSLRELARRSGVPAGTLSGIERGQREPQILTLAKVADALEVDVEELVVPPKALGPARQPDNEEPAGPSEAAENVFRSLAAGVREELATWKGDPPTRRPDEMRAVAENMQDLFVRVFAMVAQEVRPNEWSPGLKEAALEAGAHVQVMAETALQVSEKAGLRHPAIRKLPAVLTGDPAWDLALEGALAVR